MTLLQKIKGISGDSIVLHMYIRVQHSINNVFLHMHVCLYLWYMYLTALKIICESWKTHTHPDIFAGEMVAQQFGYLLKNLF